MSESRFDDLYNSLSQEGQLFFQAFQHSSGDALRLAQKMDELGLLGSLRTITSNDSLIRELILIQEGPHPNFGNSVARKGLTSAGGIISVLANAMGEYAKDLQDKLGNYQYRVEVGNKGTEQVQQKLQEAQELAVILSSDFPGKHIPRA